MTTTDDPIEVLAHELIRLRRATDAVRSRLARDAGVSLESAAMSVLFTAVRCGPQRSAELARRLGLDPSTLSRHVATLVADGLVRRAQDPGDGRAMLVQATPAGHDLYEQVSTRRAEFMGRMLASWPDTDISTLAGLLGRFNDTAETININHLTAVTVERGDT